MYWPSTEVLLDFRVMFRVYNVFVVWFVIRFVHRGLLLHHFHSTNVRKFLRMCSSGSNQIERIPLFVDELIRCPSTTADEALNL